MKAEDYSPEERIFCLACSRSGDGKSVAAASFPRKYMQYDFDGRFDGVWAALKPRGFLDPEGIEFKRFYPRKGWESFQQELDLLEKYLIAGQFPYKTIEIASITTLDGALINSSHNLQGGRMLGKLRMSGPADFNFETHGIKQVIEFLQMFPCHVIVSAHIIDKWGKPRPRAGQDIESTQYAANEVIGEKICLRDQPGEVLLSCFSNVFRFSREVVDGQLKFYVDFASDVAKNAFGIPPGLHDITGKPFYPYLQELIKKIKDGTFVAPKFENKNIFQ